jgi:SAM-dependent methyltransferase
MSYEVVTACRCCGGPDLELALDLGRQPLANSYLQAPTELPTFPLQLAVCPACCHSQLSVVVQPDLMFRHYLYVSGTSRTLRTHFAQLARDVLPWVEAHPPRVLDLACNDGTLLEAFRAQGCLVAGVEPAQNLVALARGKGLEVAEGYWPAARHQVRGKHDLITAANVLAHVADPHAFLAAALESLAPQGAVVVEIPYGRNLIEQGEWDTIYHEHLSYFLVAPFLQLLERLDASVTSVALLPIHGGSIRLAIRPGGHRHCAEILALAERERWDGFLDLATYQRFATRVGQVCDRLQELLGSLANQGRRVVGYGAAAKGNTVLNRCGLSLDYIVDDNPLKHGYLTPGRLIPIRPTTALAAEPAHLCVLLLAWNFAAEVLENVRQLRPGAADTAIFYVPEVRTQPI